MSTPPRSPCSWIQRTSSMASSTSFRKIWPMPARRSGKRPHQSASQRLCARIPASRCSYSSGLGGRAKRMKLGKNGGTVLGNTTSATTPSDSSSEKRRSSSQLRTRPPSPSWRSRNGFLYLLRQASKSSRYAGSRYSRYVSWLAPAWVSAEMIVYRWSVAVMRPRYRRYRPICPSSCSRRMSAWPAWRPVSSTMCTSTQRSDMRSGANAARAQSWSRSAAGRDDLRAAGDRGSVAGDHRRGRVGRFELAARHPYVGAREREREPRRSRPS